MSFLGPVLAGLCPQELRHTRPGGGGARRGGEAASGSALPVAWEELPGIPQLWPCFPVFLLPAALTGGPVGGWFNDSLPCPAAARRGCSREQSLLGGEGNPHGGVGCSVWRRSKSRQGPRPPSLSLSFFLCLFLREREGEGQRAGDRGAEASSVLTAASPTWGSNSRTARS